MVMPTPRLRGGHGGLRGAPSLSMCARSAAPPRGARGDDLGNDDERQGGTSRREAMARTNPFTFLQQVRQETAKVVWPTRNETLVSLVMVLIMVVIAAIFFFLADTLWAFVVGLILNVGT